MTTSVVYSFGTYNSQALNGPSGRTTWASTLINNSLKVSAKLPLAAAITFNQIKVSLKKNTNSNGQISGTVVANIYAASDVGSSPYYVYYPTGESLGTASILNQVVNSLPTVDNHPQEVTFSFSSQINLNAGNYVVVFTMSGAGNNEDDKIGVATEHFSGQYLNNLPVSFYYYNNAWAPIQAPGQFGGGFNEAIIIKATFNSVTVATNSVGAVGRKKITISEDPRQTPVLLADGSSLPTGSIVRNATSGAKLVKLPGSNTNYKEVPATPLTTWGFDAEGLEKWAIFQNFE